MPPSPLFYAATRAAWRRWLQKNHARVPHVWLVYYKKGSGKPRVDYGEAVEEALCFGWIDSTVNALDDDRYCQRFSPRRKGSKWSQPNLARVRRLIAAGLMMPPGLNALGAAGHHQPGAADNTPVTVAADIRAALRAADAWNHYETFPLAYRRIRIAWIEAARHRPTILATRLRYFVKMTAQGKRYGMLQG